MSTGLGHLIITACLSCASCQCLGQDSSPHAVTAPRLTTPLAAPSGIAGTTQKRQQSRKQTLASRAHVANDPGCRWLDNRMDQLEAQLRVKNNSFVQGYRRELTTRRREWQCLKCGAEGPSQADHSHCQHKR
ncbi:hypothetical protein LZP73_08000 [Shewanella sp. AS16]|uniref:hypothetical protein n=1 Tax=Shewanella sp. AS16 TaxID=2907625 RepID=UPI001F40CC4D|nr:hypothetical protein [Shewanella sp. AS16]MCE9686159.1 hypothetical protein [Shewanella sp. AS16]